MNEHDIRWKQRLQNFRKALATLQRASQLSESRALTELEQQGLIQGFEFTHELAWNVLKDYLEYQGLTGIIGSRDASRLAFQNGLIEDGEIWMDMIKARNLSSHTYQTDIANAIVADIQERYFPAFLLLDKKLESLA